MWYDDYYDDDGDHWNDEDNFFFGTHQGTGIGVFLRMRKKKWKNCGYKYRPFVSDDWMQKLFDPKTTKNKDVFFAECF